MSTQFLHASDVAMVEVTRRLAGAVAPGGYLLVVGHAPGEHFHHPDPARARALWLAADLLPAVSDGFEVLVCEQRPRPAVRDGRTVQMDDSTLLARRVGPEV